jgi:di/tricarboxylate transporter
MLTVGRRLIPGRRPAENLERTFRLTGYLTDLVLEDGSDSVGRTLAGAPLVSRFDLDVLEMTRADGTRFLLPSADKVLRVGDALRVRVDAEAIESLKGEPGITLASREAEPPTDGVLVETVVLPGSSLVGRSLVESRFRNTHRATVLAIRQRGALVHRRLKTVPLAAGDTLLLEARPEQLETLRSSEDLAVVSETGGRRPLAPGRLALAAALLVGAVVAAALGLSPIVASATVAAVLAVATGCLSLEEAYESIDWQVIFLLAGVLTLGEALETTGGAALVAQGLLTFLGPLGPVALVAGFYLVTTILTEVMSNNATVALLAPVALVAGETLGIDARPLLVAVTVAASSSFMTPVGYQTNTLIYGPGQYRFGDFLRVGAPLNLLFWIVSSLVIPLVWPF